MPSVRTTKTTNKINPKAYKKQAPNAKAITQASAWLKAAKIPVKPSQTPGCDLIIARRGGGELEVKVGISYDDARPTVDHLFVLACELTSRHSATALRAFGSITVAAGYGALKPIDRGPEPVKKLHFDDNFELVAMRHKEFRKVPNPTNAELAEYDRVINKATSRALYINAKICRRHMLQFDDLKTYAQIWTSNYLGLYKVADPTDNDNERKLYAHLCQRFFNFIEVLLKKERNCIATPETVCIAVLGKPYEPRKTSGVKNGFRDYEDDLSEWLNAEASGEHSFQTQDDDLGVDPDFSEDFESGFLLNNPEADAAAEEKERKLTESKRRKLAQQTLKEALGSMNHDTLITTLAEAGENTFLCYDARAEAKKQLRLHQEACPTCIKLREVAAQSALQVKV